jgi:hypothetical protein
MWLACLMGGAALAADAELASPVLSQDLEFQRHQDLGRMGLTTMGVGLGVGVAYPVGALLACSLLGGDWGCAAVALLVGIPVELGAVGAVLAGETMLFAGGIGAGRVAQRAGAGSPGMGLAGAWLVGGGTLAIVLAAPGQQSYDAPLAIAGVGAVVIGTGLGVAQLSHNNRASLAVSPTLHGVRITGEF